MNNFPMVAGRIQHKGPIFSKKKKQRVPEEEQCLVGAVETGDYLSCSDEGMFDMGGPSGEKLRGESSTTLQRSTLEIRHSSSDLKQTPYLTNEELEGSDNEVQSILGESDLYAEMGLQREINETPESPSGNEEMGNNNVGLKSLLSSEGNRPWMEMQNNISIPGSSTLAWKWGEHLSDDERTNVEILYLGLKSEVESGSCTVTLYKRSSQAAMKWTPVATGVPLLVLDKTALPFNIFIIVAEKGTGLALWKDQLTSKSQFNRWGPLFYCLAQSSDSHDLSGFFFAHKVSGWTFFSKVEEMMKKQETSENPLPKSAKTVKQKQKKLSKNAISLPCCFRRFASVVAGDRTRYQSLKSLVPQLPENKPDPIEDLESDQLQLRRSS